MLPKAVSPNRRPDDARIEFSEKVANIAARRPFAIAIGTQAYKRIDKTIRVYEALKPLFGIVAFIVVGKRISSTDRTDVIFIEQLSHEDVLVLLQRARLFISTSEIESSPNALVEALCKCESVAVSPIELDKELLSKVGPEAESFEDT